MLPTSKAETFCETFQPVFITRVESWTYAGLTCTLPKYRHIVFVAPETVNVLVDPAHGFHLISETQVTMDIFGAISGVEKPWKIYLGIVPKQFFDRYNILDMSWGSFFVTIHLALAAEITTALSNVEACEYTVTTEQ